MSFLQPPNTQSYVIRTYAMGIRFEGTREERRSNEKDANQRVRGLQIQQNDIIHDAEALETSMNFTRTQPNQSHKFAKRYIQKVKKNYSNISDSAYYWLHLASRGVVDREKKVKEFLSLLNTWNEQAIEWFIFGRSPRVENALVSHWNLKRLYILNLISSTRWQIDKYCTPDVKFNSHLPLVTQQEIEDAIHLFYSIKSNEKQVGKVSNQYKAFLKKLELICSNFEIIAPYITSWINLPQKSRWKSLKKLSKTISEVLCLRNVKLFSALRAIVIFALSPYMGKNVFRILKTIYSEQITPLPFIKKKRRNIPIILLMNKDHVILRPGNATQMTDLVKKKGMFDLVFVLKHNPRIYGTLVFSKRVQQYIHNGARIKVLMIQSGSEPSCKLKVSVVLEGDYKAFISTELIHKLIKQLRIKRTNFLGLDINRLGKYALAFSIDIPLTKKLLSLMNKYEKLSSIEIPRLSSALKNAGRIKHSYRYVKVKGELSRIYNKRKKILKEVKNYVAHFIAAVIVRSGCKVFCIENFRIDPRGKRGALAKAIYNMPDDSNIFEKAVFLASSVLNYGVKLVLVDPRKTSTYHNGCKGIIHRTRGSYDIAKCKKCGKLVNTHTNAAKNIRDIGFKSLKTSNFPFPQARGMDQASIKSV